MALQKDYVTKQGVTGTYHKVNETLINIEVDVYLNADTRKAGSSFLERLQFEKTFTEDELKVEGKSRKVLAYEYLKTLNEYSNSTDV